MRGVAPAALALALASVAAWGDDPARLTADAASAGLQQVDFIAHTGEVVVQASKDDGVHVKLQLEQQQRSLLWLFHWMSDDTARDIAGATIKLDRTGNHMSVGLSYPSGDTHSDVKERWIVEIPAGLSLAAGLDAGRMVIDGMQGGVDASLSAGDLTIRSLKGPVRGRVSAGRLHVSSDTTQPGNISLGSTFGLAVLSLNGQYFGPPQKHGMLAGLHFFGNSIVHASGGKDDLDLQVTAGLVDLRVGPLGDEKTYRELFKSQ